MPGAVSTPAAGSPAPQPEPHSASSSPSSRWRCTEAGEVIKPRPSVPTLTVWIYDSALGAAAGEVRLKDLRQRNALRVHDAITVTWVPGAHQPRIGHLRRKTSAGAARDSLLGGMVDLVFRTPDPGSSARAGIVDLAERLAVIGIDLVFLEELRASSAPRPALLVLSSDADLDQVRPVIERGLARGDVILKHARLPDDGLDVLQQAVHDLQARDHEG